MRRSVVLLFGRGPAKPKGRGGEILGYHPRQLVELPEEVPPGDKVARRGRQLDNVCRIEIILEIIEIILGTFFVG